MRVLKKNFKKGFAKVVPKTLDDLWHLYNIVHKGDVVCARSTRELKVNAEFSRPQKGRRVSVFLCIRAENIVWDRTLNRLRIKGKIHEAPENIAGRGSHHTLAIGINKPLTIVKDEWLKHEIDRLHTASLHEAPPIIVVSIDSERCCVSSIRQYGIDVKVEIKARLPSKLEPEKRANALRGYFRQALTDLSNAWQRNRCSIVIIGVGFIKQQFANYVRSQDKDLAQSVLGVKSVNVGGVAGIREALRSGILENTLKHLRIAEEAKVVEHVLTRLGKEKKDVAYGLESAEEANMLGAIETLLISDSALRDTSDEKRISLEELMRDVEKKSGKVVVISVEHEAGQKLLALGGVAALLRFPVN